MTEMFLKSDVAVKVGLEVEARARLWGVEARVHWYLDQARPLGVETKFFDRNRSVRTPSKDQDFMVLRPSHEQDHSVSRSRHDQDFEVLRPSQDRDQCRLDQYESCGTCSPQINLKDEYFLLNTPFPRLTNNIIRLVLTRKKKLLTNRAKHSWILITYLRPKLWNLYSSPPVTKTRLFKKPKT